MAKKLVENKITSDLDLINDPINKKAAEIYKLIYCKKKKKR